MFQGSLPLFPAGVAPLTSAAPDAGKFSSEAGLVRVEVLKADAKPYVVTVKSPFFPAIKKGDTLQVSFQIRCLSSKASDERGTFKGYIQVDKGAWEGIGDLGGTLLVGSAWQTFYISGKAAKDFAEGTVNFVLHLASVVQTLEIRALTGLNRGDAPLTVVPENPMSYPGREADAAWRKEAAERIEKHRKGTLTLQVVDSKGRPLPGAEISLQLKRHTYAFGSFTDAKPAQTDADAERYRKTMQQMFNRVTIPWYWADWGTESPTERPNYERIAAWARDAGFEIKAHCLIYPHYLPESVKKLSPAARRTAILAQAVRGIKDTAKYNVAVWDVLNELRNDPELEKEFGAAFYAEIFQTARQADPKARLYINEFGVEAVGAGYDANLALYEKQIVGHLANKAPLDGIAIQAHFGLDAPGPESVWKALDRLGRFKLPIEIAEFDVATRDDASQADYLRDFVTACFAHPATSGVTLWGFWEGSMWRPEAALIRKDWTPRPAALAWNKLQATWTTKASGRTDKSGVFSGRGFYGRYEVTIRHAGLTRVISFTLIPKNTSVVKIKLS